ncbi:hypothetical protein [Cytobacillus pseudoceanisediminis]|uniref:hypothetical protein n=1 Tax=Cytobacillus pseudoceanisediminis TaxID=3051614 RepID=UPI003CE7AD4B
MKKYAKQFKNVETKSVGTLNQFELTIVRLRTNNEELANLHATVDAEIEQLHALKENIVERIASNESAIHGLERLLRGE